jgi:Ca2+-binding EF-hand superfamily protein
MKTTNKPYNAELDLSKTRILKVLCTESRRRGLRFEEFFRDFDHLRHGHCSQSGLNCILTQLNIKLSQTDRDLLLSLYNFGTQKEFGYRSFLRDCEEMLGSVTNSSLDSSATKKRNTKVDHAIEGTAICEGDVLEDPKAVLVMLQAHVYEKQVGLREYFHDFDHLRKGFIPREKLRSVLSLVNFPVSESAVQSLSRAYSHNSEGFDYLRLCDDVEKDLICARLDKNPLGEPPSSFCLLTAKEGTKPTLTQSELELISEAEDRIRRRSQQRRVNLSVQFRSYDRYNRLLITSNQFSRAMKSMEFEIPESHLEVLFKKYCIHGSLSLFAYRAFCASIDS